jgi:hypothetical protein
MVASPTPSTQAMLAAISSRHVAERGDEAGNIGAGANEAHEVHYGRLVGSFFP